MSVGPQRARARPLIRCSQDIPDKSVQAYALRLPDSSTLGEEMDVIEPDALYKALG